MPILEHYRDLDPGPFGAPVRPQRRFEATTEAQVRAALRAAAAGGHDTIELSGPALNPIAGHAEMLARAFAEEGRDLRIRCAEWLLPDPPARAVLPLLRRVDALEIEYPSSAPSARRLYRRRWPPQRYRALIERMRRHGIEPVLVVRPGLPGESEASVLDMLRRVYALAPQGVRVAPFTAEPGSFFAANRARFRLAVEAAPSYRVLAHRGANSFELRWLVAICEKSMADYLHWKSAAAHARAVDS
jgi:hypothetical protein